MSRQDRSAESLALPWPRYDGLALTCLAPAWRRATEASRQRGAALPKPRAAVARAFQASVGSDARRHVLLDGRDGFLDVRVGVVEMRREADARPILAAARRAADAIFLVQRGRELADVEAARLERQ